MDDEAQGLNLSRLGAWMQDSVPDAGGNLSARLIAGGKSNLTYEVSDGFNTWIVRRPPLGHVLATAHDMAREHRVMSALHETDVPVPKTYALCRDDSVLGAPFYVMERVSGRTYRYAAELDLLGPQRSRSIGEALVDTLVSVHTIDPASVGLGDLGRPEGFLARQVQRWRKQLDASHTRDLPGANQLFAWLVEDVPHASTPGIVHGDFRLDNVITDDTDRPAAVIDWEMATLGDPLTDLALMLVYGRLAEVLPRDVVDYMSAPGFPSEPEIINRYSISSGRDLSDFGFYLGLASYKLAGILEGVYYRYVHGQTVGDGFDHIGNVVPYLLEGGLSAMQEY